MKTEKLSRANKGKIRSEIKQILAAYAAAGLVLTIVVAAFAIFLLEKEQGSMIIAFIILLLCLGALGYLYYLIKDHLSDLAKGLKYSYLGQVTDKSARVKWAWHGNLAADAVSQPNVTEFVLLVDGKEIYLAKEAYDRFDIGDKVWVSISPKSKLILELNREAPSSGFERFSS